MLLQVDTYDARLPPPPSTGGVVVSRLPRGEMQVGGEGGGISVKFVLDGEERYEGGGHAWALRAGEFLLVDPRRPLRAVARRSAAGVCLRLPGRIAAPAAGCVFPARTSAFGQFLALTAERLVGMDPEETGDAAPLLSDARRQLDSFAMEIAARAERLDATKPATRAERLRRLEAARAHLTRNLDRSVSLQELSGVSGMSPFHLARNFAAVFGEPPGRYHAGLRLARAAELLRDAPTDAAAEALGYADTGAFARAFRRRYGVGPGKFRKTGPS